MRGVGVSKKNFPPWGMYGYFLELHDKTATVYMYVYSICF